MVNFDIITGCQDYIIEFSLAAETFIFFSEIRLKKSIYIYIYMFEYEKNQSEIANFSVITFFFIYID
jgi:hypothetical protein